VRGHLSVVGGHLSTVDAGLTGAEAALSAAGIGLTGVGVALTTVGIALTDVNAPSSVVETARSNAGVPPTIADASPLSVETGQTGEFLSLIFPALGGFIHYLNSTIVNRKS